MVTGELIGKPVDHRPVALHERMERGAVASRRAGYEVGICRRTVTDVHCQEYDVKRAAAVDRRRACRGARREVRRPGCGGKVTTRQIRWKNLKGAPRASLLPPRQLY